MQWMEEAEDGESWECSLLGAGGQDGEEVGDTSQQDVAYS